MTRSKILIVEDDDDLREGLARRLTASGYDVVFAADGLAAVSAAFTERPDLVLLDIGLPGGSGLTVLRRYSNIASLILTPVVVLTGRDPMAVEGAVRKYGVAGFLTKPADNDELLRVIARALRGEPDPDAYPSDADWPPQLPVPNHA
jgi:DNA-binding response OmpR family regulator